MSSRDNTKKNGTLFLLQLPGCCRGALETASFSKIRSFSRLFLPELFNKSSSHLGFFIIYLKRGAGEPSMKDREDKEDARFQPVISNNNSSYMILTKEKSSSRLSRSSYSEGGGEGSWLDEGHSKRPLCLESVSLTLVST